MSVTRRKCFISYHHADQAWIDRFVNTFDHAHDLFIARGLGQVIAQDIIDSTDADYVMRRIRDLYIGDSTVTLVMLGKCTWARRYVDWEIQSSLRASQNGLPNGLLGIKLPIYSEGMGYPDRLNKNLLGDQKKAEGQLDCYARCISYPRALEDLWLGIESAFQRRFTHARLIENPRDRPRNNRQCG
jgi:hypothetical protein